MQPEAMIMMMKSLKLTGMAQAVADLSQQGSPAYQAALPILGNLLKAEVAEREVRLVGYQLKVAKWKGLGKTDAMDLVNTFNPRSSECHQYRNEYSPASIARKP